MSIIVEHEGELWTLPAFDDKKKFNIVKKNYPNSSLWIFQYEKGISKRVPLKELK